MPDSQIVIDRNMYKIMRYIYKYHVVSFSTLQRRFGEDNAHAILSLVLHGYAILRLPDGALTSDISYLPHGLKIALLPPGNKYCEDRMESDMMRRIPVLLSAVSVIVSIVALIVSLISANNEIFVHILK